MFLKLKITAVIFTMAALLLFSGCAMKTDIIRVEDKIDAMRVDQQKMNNTVTRLDSMMTTEASGNAEVRAQMSSAISDLTDQFRIMQANMNDLMSQVANLVQNQGSRPTYINQQTGPDSGRTATSPPPGVDCQTLYDDSFVNVRRGQYQEAIKGFNDYLKYCGAQESAADARFWIGESYYSLDDYKEALSQFSQVIKDYPSSKKGAGAMYKMGRCYEELGQKKEAKATFNKIVTSYPGTLEATQAKEKLKELK
jgi:tol-pal system protein YbgF